MKHPYADLTVSRVSLQNYANLEIVFSLSLDFHAARLSMYVNLASLLIL